jgi:hypothetical protein
MDAEQHVGEVLIFTFAWMLNNAWQDHQMFAFSPRIQDLGCLKPRHSHVKNGRWKERVDGDCVPSVSTLCLS